MYTHSGSSNDSGDSSGSGSSSGRMNGCLQW
jgi:hypothetical protein